MSRRSLQIVGGLVTILVTAAASVWVNIVTGSVTSTTIAGFVAVIVMQVVTQIVVIFLEDSQQEATPAAESETTRAELLLDMDRDAKIRLRERWQALQLSDEAVERLEATAASLFTPFEIPNCGVIVMTGALGSGKSTYADLALRRYIAAAYMSEREPWPIYFDSRRLAKTGLLDSIGELRDSGIGEPYILIVDGCDELPRESAARILREARYVYNSYPKSLVILLSRPGYLSWRDEIQLPALTEDASELLMQTVAGHDVRLWNLPVELRTVAHRPLFAILAARYFFGAGRGPQTRSGLLSALVEDVLRRDDALNEEIFSKLRALAVSTIIHGGKVEESQIGSAETREALIATRLVVCRDGYVTFAAPVIEQYFAALALLRDEIRASNHASSLSEWERWRAAWVLAVSIGSWQEVTALITVLAANFPGAAAWLVGQTIADLGAPRDSDGDGSDTSLTDSEWASRLNLAFNTWTQGFAEVARAQNVLDGNNSRVVRIIARSVKGSGIYVAGWSGLSEPTQAQIDRSRNIFEPPPDNGWFFRYSTGTVLHPNWPWRFTLSRIGDEVERLLRVLRWSPEVPALAVEQQWDVIETLAPASAKTRMREGKFDEAAQSTIQQIADVISMIRTEGALGLHTNRRIITLHQLESARQRLVRDDPSQVLRSPWPGPDHIRSGSWVSSGYSADRLAQRAELVYQACLEGYRQLVDAWFPAAKLTLGLTAMMPVRLDGEVEVADDGMPTIIYDLWPLPAGEQSVVNVRAVKGESPMRGQLFDFEGHGRQLTHMIHTYRNETSAWINYTSNHAVLDIFHRMPATRLAVRWLWDDLQHIKVTKSAAPFT